MKIREFEVEQMGELVPHIEEEVSEGNFVTMRKDVWEAKEAAKEQSGTL